MPIYEVDASAAGAGVGFIPLLEEEDADIVQKNILQFEDLCQKNGIAYRVHKDFYSFALPELKRESRFADVIILSGELFYKGVIESNQFDYLRDAMHAAESPVLIPCPNITSFPITIFFLMMAQGNVCMLSNSLLIFFLN